MDKRDVVDSVAARLGVKLKEKQLEAIMAFISGRMSLSHYQLVMGNP